MEFREEFEILEDDQEEKDAELSDTQVRCWVGTWNNPNMRSIKTIRGNMNRYKNINLKFQELKKILNNYELSNKKQKSRLEQEINKLSKVLNSDVFSNLQILFITYKYYLLGILAQTNRILVKPKRNKKKNNKRNCKVNKESVSLISNITFDSIEKFFKDLENLQRID